MRKWTTTPVVVLVAIMVVSFVLRSLFLTAKSFDIDEAFSMAIARYDGATFLQSVTTREANMVLYYALLRFWRALGENEAIIRMLSVLPAVATVPLLYSLGTRLFDQRVGIIGALLLSFNAYHIRYAQEARSYSLAVLLVTLSWFFFVRSIEQPSRKHWTGYILMSVLSVYCHFFSGLVLVSQWVSLAFLGRRETPMRGLLVSLALIGALVLPLGAFSLARAGLFTWIPHPRLSNIAGVYYVLAGGSGTLARASAIGIALMLAYFGLALTAALDGARTWARTGASFDTWRYGLLLTWLILPVVLAFGVSLVKPIFIAYYLIVCLPPLTLLTAVGLTSIRRRWAFVSTLAVVVVLATHQTYAYYKDFGLKEDYRDSTYRLLSLAAPGDVVLFDAPFGHDGFDYYQRMFPGAPRVTTLPAWDGDSTRHHRVWLVENSGSDTREIQTTLSRQYPSVQEWSFPGIRLFLYKKL